MSQKYSITFLKPFIKIFKFFGLSPSNVFDLKVKQNNYHKIYTYCIIIIFIAGYIFSEYAKIIYVYPRIILPLAITVMVNYFSLIVMTVVSILMVTIVHKKSFVALFTNLQKLENDLRLNLRLNYTVGSLPIICFVGILLLNSPMFFGAYVWLQTMTVFTYFCFLPSEIEYVHFNLVMFLMCGLAFSIFNKYSQVNDYLVTTTNGFTKSGDVNVEFLYFKLKHVRMLYNVLNDTVNKVNKIFGFVIVSTVIVIISNLLRYMMVLIVYTVYKNNISDSPYNDGLLTLSLLWITSSLVSIEARIRIRLG